MGVKRLVEKFLSYLTRHASVEFYVHALAAALLLLAEILSTAVVGYAEPVAEALPRAYLAMMHHGG
jgi:hypothetical protein